MATPTKTAAAVRSALSRLGLIAVETSGPFDRDRADPEEARGGDRGGRSSSYPVPCRPPTTASCPADTWSSARFPRGLSALCPRFPHHGPSCLHRVRQAPRTKPGLVRHLPLSARPGVPREAQGGDAPGQGREGSYPGSDDRLPGLWASSSARLAGLVCVVRDPGAQPRANGAVLDVWQAVDAGALPSLLPEPRANGRPRRYPLPLTIEYRSSAAPSCGRLVARAAGSGSLLGGPAPRAHCAGEHRQRPELPAVDRNRLDRSKPCTIRVSSLGPDPVDRCYAATSDGRRPD